jgi:hypothetical protein
LNSPWRIPNKTARNRQKPAPFKIVASPRTTASATENAGRAYLRRIGNPVRRAVAAVRGDDGAWRWRRCLVTRRRVVDGSAWRRQRAERRCAEDVLGLHPVPGDPRIARRERQTCLQSDMSELYRSASQDLVLRASALRFSPTTLLEFFPARGQAFGLDLGFGEIAGQPSCVLAAAGIKRWIRK